METSLHTEDRFIETPDGQIFARIWGDLNVSSGLAPLVLLHDSLGCVELWRDFPAQLATATGRAIVAYDRLGYGQSDPHPGPMGFDFLHKEARVSLSSLRAQLHIERMILFGHSVGGEMSAACAVVLPEAIAAVITESAQAFIEECTAATIRKAREDFRAPEQLARLARYHGDKARWVLDAWTETWLSPQFLAWCIDEDMRRVRCPVLAMQGDSDEFGTRAHAERIGSFHPASSEVVIFKECGHVPHREKPDEVLRAVSGFLERRVTI